MKEYRETVDPMVVEAVLDALVGSVNPDQASFDDEYAAWCNVRKYAAVCKWCADKAFAAREYTYGTDTGKVIAADVMNAFSDALEGVLDD